MVAIISSIKNIEDLYAIPTPEISYTCKYRDELKGSEILLAHLNTKVRITHNHIWLVSGKEI